MEWIPRKTPPKVGSLCLVLNTNCPGSYFLATYLKNKKKGYFLLWPEGPDHHEIVLDVTHYIDLPDPPKGGRV